MNLVQNPRAGTVRRMGRILRHEVVDSTSERAFAALAEGTARDGDVHVARGQTAGRGRLGRRWESPAGEGLYLSRIHLPAPPGPAAAGVTMAAGLAVRDAVLRVGLPGARLDWPNDVMVRDAKLAGILVESRGFDPIRPHFVVGIGVNVLQRDFPRDLQRERAVTSLAAEGVATSPTGLLDVLLPLLERRLAQASADRAALARDYLAATGMAGAPVRVRTAEGTVEGRLVGIDFEAGVRLASDEGERRFDLPHVHGVERTPI